MGRFDKPPLQGRELAGTVQRHHLIRYAVGVSSIRLHRDSAKTGDHRTIPPDSRRFQRSVEYWSSLRFDALGAIQETPSLRSGLGWIARLKRYGSSGCDIA